MPPPTLADVDGGAGVWTAENDISPSDPTTKPIETVACSDTEEVTVAAITQRLEAGNFQHRFNRELVDEWIFTLAVAHARLAESELLDQIDAGSTSVSTGTVLGTTRDVVAALDRAAAGYRDRQRLADGAFLTCVLPSWLKAMIRSDVARQLPGDNMLAISDAQIDGLFTSRGISPIWSIDAEAMVAHQGQGALAAWPSFVSMRIFSPGSWLYLDGGTLDVGIVRDSTLNSTNDFQVFAETFESLAFVGTESLRVTADVCPDGSSAATVNTGGICATGS